MIIFYSIDFSSIYNYLNDLSEDAE